MYHLTPKQIVAELDRYIVKQDDAKKSVAIALRNRWRRQQADDSIRDEIIPNNIIMIGPTGVGKTEIARRLARLVNAPFVKVEASNYTEVGYMGRDVESIIRDLVEIAVGMVTQEQKEKVQAIAELMVEKRLVDLLMPQPASAAPGVEEDAEAAQRRERTREKLRAKLAAGDLEEREITVKTSAPTSPIIEIFSKSGLEDFNVQMPGGSPGGFNPFAGRSQKERKVTVREARRILEEEESEKLLDREKVVDEAKHLVETGGMVFIDEIDKIAGKAVHTTGPDVSREGVQRDLLPIVEGASVNTRHGVVKTDHILFIAAGAFNVAKPSDLIPEFQGRFPIRVELASLTQDDFERILREPDASLLKQYTALLAAEGCELTLDAGAIKEVARVAFTANERSENIGARRLQTVLATLLEEVLFELPESGRKKAEFTAEDVKDTLDSILADEDLTRYIL
jgi:ATP-dependent HslUV protease ATP-binding subunit HslU